MDKIKSRKLWFVIFWNVMLGGALISDAFFPKTDNIDFAAKAGIKAIIQTGGSIADNDVIAAADKHKMAMVMTAVRHFKH